MPDPDVTEDALLGGTVRLLQVRTGHRAGTDAVLLAGLCGGRSGDRVVDLGAASGAVGLMVAARVAVARLTFVDRDAGLVALCRRNADLNGLSGHATAVLADILSADGLEGLDAGAADLVVTNPPYFDEATPASPHPGRRAAHRMEGDGLGTWLGVAARLLAHRGRLALVHRADALGTCLAALPGVFGSVEIVPIHPRAERPANRIVLRAVKNGRSALRMMPGLVLHGPDGPTAEATALHGPPERTPAPG